MSSDWDEYVESVRGWFNEKILIPLTGDIQQVDAQLESTGLGHLASRFPATYSMAAKAADSKEVTASGGSASAAAASTGGYFLGLGGGGMSKIATLMDLVQARTATDPLVKARLRIERYLSMAPTTSQRLTLIKRISSLSQGANIQLSNTVNEQDDLQVITSFRNIHFKSA